MECVDVIGESAGSTEENDHTVYATRRSGALDAMGNTFWDMGVVMIMIMMVPAILPRSTEMAVLMGAFLVLILPLLALMRVMTRFVPRPRRVEIDNVSISMKQGWRSPVSISWDDEIQISSGIFRQESSLIPVVVINGQSEQVDIQPARYDHKGIPLLRDLESRFQPYYDQQLESYLTGEKDWTSGKMSVALKDGRIIFRKKDVEVASFASPDVLRIDFLLDSSRQLAISYTGGQCTLEELPTDWHILLYALRTKLGLERNMHPRLDVIEKIGDSGDKRSSGLLVPLLFMQGMVAASGILALAMAVILTITQGGTPITFTALGVQFLLAAYLGKRCYGFFKRLREIQKNAENYDAAYAAEVTRMDASDADGGDSPVLTYVESQAVEGRYAYDLSQIAWSQLVAWLAVTGLIGGGWWYYSQNGQDDIFGIPLMIAAPIAMVLIGIAIGRFLEAWIIKNSLAVIQTRSPRWIKNPADALYMDFMPRETWGKFKLETAKDTGPLFVDSEAQKVYWEAGEQRLAFPAPSIISCNVEEGGASAGALNVVALVLVAHTPEGPQEFCFCIRKEGKADKHREVLQKEADKIALWSPDKE